MNHKYKNIVVTNCYKFEEARGLFQGSVLYIVLPDSVVNQSRPTSVFLLVMIRIGMCHAILNRIKKIEQAGYNQDPWKASVQWAEWAEKSLEATLNSVTSQ